MVLRLVFIAFLLLLGACGDLSFENPTDPRNFSHPKNPEIKYEDFTDSRDGKTYKSVVIGEQTWMAENLNYDESGSYCVYCDIYGRLYGWEDATRVCPDGWHLPSIGEWYRLLSFADWSWTDLKSEKGWAAGLEGTDIYGFSALPGGGGEQYYEDMTGDYGSWWSNTTADGGAYFANTGSYNGTFASIYDFYSVRCVKDVFCGGQLFSPEIQVCENDIIYYWCGYNKYNPANQQRCENDIVETACGNDWFDATNDNLRCNNNILESKCGIEWCNPLTHFCTDDIRYELCNGYAYEPATQRCGTGILEVKCGTEWYNPETHFCTGDIRYELCYGNTYDPATQQCGTDGALKAQCGTEWYDPTTHFCLNDTPYELCNGQLYDPATQRCGTDGILESKCGTAWYNPATHSCSGNNIYERSSSSSAPSSSSFRSSSSGYN